VDFVPCVALSEASTHGERLSPERASRRWTLEADVAACKSGHWGPTDVSGALQRTRMTRFGCGLLNAEHSHPSSTTGPKRPTHPACRHVADSNNPSYVGDARRPG
jgi:hypothetical protein